MNTFEILENTASDTTHTFRIKFNTDHPVYEGHFPDIAVTPGVMLLQVVERLAAQVTGAQLTLAEARNLKFMKPVLPREGKVFDVNLTATEQDGQVSVKADANSDGESYFKVSAKFDRHIQG